MREALLGKLVLLLVRASREDLATICGFLQGQPLPRPRPRGGPSAPPRLVPEAGPPRTGADARSAYSFRKAGKLWRVVFAGGEPFYLADTLGARYLDYLLHEPNVPIGAFDLEVAVTPEKGAARARGSIQPESDPRALREYRAALRSLQAERQRARESGDPGKVGDLDREIKRLNAALGEHGGMADTGERARSNVRHAINAVMAQLRNGSRPEQAFAEHLEGRLSAGIECLYSQPAGRIWD